ncbi:MAG: pilus assembly protein TadG-related protein [Roseiflexaceae bacterium]
MQRSEGQAVVLAALAFIVMIGALGLALDGANAYNQRRNANNAADAAAMAGTRALLAANESGSGRNSDVYQAVDAYLDTHLPASSGTLIKHDAYYIDRNGNQIGGAIPNNNSAVQVIDMADSARVRGIAVDIQFKFKTFFMPLLGRNDLTVAGYGLGLVGALGGATGPDLIPLAISDTAAARWESASPSEQSRNWSMWVYTSTVTLGSRDIDQSDLRLLELRPGGALPTYGSSGDCSSGTPIDKLIYWLCKGTAYNMVTTPDPVNTINMPPNNSLKAAITSRVSSNPDVLLPVYNQLDLSGHVKIVGFLAVRLTSFSTSGSSNGILKGKIVNYYLAPGPISGESSGFFDTYAINLVR